MDWLEEKIGKWTRGIEKVSDKETADRVMGGSECLKDTDAAARARWFADALKRLEAAIPDLETRRKILTGCSCVFADEFGQESLLSYRKIYKVTSSVQKVLDAMRRDRSKFATSVLVGNVIYEKRDPRDREAFGKAQTPEERRLAACFCPLVRQGKVPFPEPYCYCSAGWFVGIWEGIIEKPVHVEVVKSLLRGDETCEFTIELPQEITQ